MVDDTKIVRTKKGRKVTMVKQDRKFGKNGNLQYKIVKNEKA